MKENLIREKSFGFALQVIDLHRKLVKDHDYVISRQLLKSATSIGANVEEAQAAQSRADFISKMSIASKEARETCYWLRLLRDSHSVSEVDANILLSEAETIVNILTSIVKTTANKC